MIKPTDTNNTTNCHLVNSSAQLTDGKLWPTGFTSIPYDCLITLSYIQGRFARTHHTKCQWNSSSKPCCPTALYCCNSQLLPHSKGVISGFGSSSVTVDKLLPAICNCDIHVKLQMHMNVRFGDSFSSYVHFNL